MARPGRGTGQRAAGAVPSRLSQPQPDAAPGRALHHRLPGRAHGAGHLRPGSLLRDSYVDLSEATVDELIAYFIALKRRRAEMRSRIAPGSGISGGRFDMMALQRNLKALGTFGYQTSARSNPVYMQYIPARFDTCRRICCAIQLGSGACAGCWPPTWMNCGRPRSSVGARDHRVATEGRGQGGSELHFARSPQRGPQNRLRLCASGRSRLGAAFALWPAAPTLEV